MKLTKKELLEYAKPAKININLSANFMGSFGLSDKFGSRYNLSSEDVFLKELQKFTSVDLSIFSYEEPYWVSEDTVEPLESDLEEGEEVIEVNLPVEEEVPSEEVVDALEDTKTPDWGWVDSLEDSPENRLALDEYAEKFSVKLRRSMKVSNMAKKFKKALKQD